jgi:ketosteroid isomerase-like protein
MACVSETPPAEEAVDEPAVAEPAAASEPAPITQQDVEAYAERADAAIRTGDTAAFNNFYADDALMISARGRVEGGAALAAFWRDAVATGSGRSLQSEILKFGSDRDLAWALSRFTGGVTAPAGHTLRVFQRQADGSLRTVVQLSMPDMPAQR